MKGASKGYGVPFGLHATCVEISRHFIHAGGRWVWADSRILWRNPALTLHNPALTLHPHTQKVYGAENG